jgi:hypothetical protein
MKLDMKTNARIVGIGGTARQDSTRATNARHLSVCTVVSYEWPRGG